MLKLCKLRSRDRARDLWEAKDSILVLESPALPEPINYTCMHVILRNLLFTTHCISAGYISRQKYTRLRQFLAFARTVEHESEAKSFIMLSNLDCCSTERDPLKNGSLKHQTLLQFKRFSLLVAFFWSTGASQTVRVLACFIVCHALASFCVSKSCVVAGAVSQAGRLLALAHASTRIPGSLTALDVEADNQTSVEAFRFSAFSGRTCGNTVHLRCLSSWMLYIGWRHRLRTCQLWLRSTLVPLREETDYLGGQYNDRNYPTPFSSRYPPKSWSNHSLWLHGIQGENYTSFHPKHGWCHALESNGVDLSHRCETTILGSPNFWSG